MDQTHIQALACQASHLPSPAMYLFILMIMYVWHPRNIPFEPYDLCQAPSSSPPYHRNTHPSLGCMVIRHLQHGIPTFVWENAGQGRERCKRRGGGGLSHTSKAKSWLPQWVLLLLPLQLYLPVCPQGEDVHLAYTLGFISLGFEP